jgi:hypothetical protein
MRMKGVVFGAVLSIFTILGRRGAGPSRNVCSWASLFELDMICRDGAGDVLFALRTKDDHRCHACIENGFGHQSAAAFGAEERLSGFRDVLDGFNFEPLSHPNQGHQFVLRDGTARPHEAVVTDAHKATRQDMHEVTADELGSIKSHTPLTVGIGFDIGEGYPAFDNRDDATVGDGCLEHIGGQVLHDALPVLADRFAVNDPSSPPDGRGYAVMQPVVLDQFAEDAFEDCGQRLARGIEVLACAAPKSLVHVDSAAGNDEVDVGMEVQRPAPGMQHAEETGQVDAQEPRVACQFLESTGGRVEQGGEPLPWAVDEEGVELLRHGKGDQEVVGGQLLLQPFVEPLGGLFGLAGWAHAIAT